MKKKSLMMGSFILVLIGIAFAVFCFTFGLGSNPALDYGKVWAEKGYLMPLLALAVPGAVALILLICRAIGGRERKSIILISSLLMILTGIAFVVMLFLYDFQYGFLQIATFYPSITISDYLKSYLDFKLNVAIAMRLIALIASLVALIFALVVAILGYKNKRVPAKVFRIITLVLCIVVIVAYVLSLSLVNDVNGAIIFSSDVYNITASYYMFSLYPLGVALALGGFILVGHDAAVSLVEKPVAPVEEAPVEAEVVEEKPAEEVKEEPKE